MKKLERRNAVARWPLIAAMALAASAAIFAWAFLVREKDAALSEDELREMEAFEEYERQKQGAA